MFDLSLFASEGAAGRLRAMRARLRWPFVWSTFVLVAALAVACGGGASKNAGRLRLAVVPKGTAHDFWQSVHAGAKTAAEALGVDIEWQGPNPEGDREKQITLVETFVTRRVDGILLAPVDHTALAAPVADAKRSGVPTVVFDSGLEGTAHVSFVASDNRRGGEQAGEKLGELLGGQGKVIVLRFMEGSASTTAREAGCLDTLRKRFPGIAIVSDNQYAPNLEKARTAADALLLRHPDATGVFCPNESTTHGMLLALDAVGKAGVVKFVGFDSSPPLLEGLRKAHIHALVVQDPVTMGRRGVELLVAHVRGEVVPKAENTALVVATPENREQPAIRALLHPDLSVLGR